jgi:hypothetical protein
MLAAALAVTGAVLLAVVNTFGAWAVVRRHSSLAFLFFAAAVALTVGAVAVLFGFPGARVGVLVGAVLTSLASYWNARVVIGRVVAVSHLLRAAVGAALFACTVLATPGV